jgi:molybdopterin adenylyltransferase
MIRTAVLTISDRSSRGERADLSGPALIEEIHGLGWEMVKTGLVPDELSAIQSVLIEWCENMQIDLILTTGGTGFSPRDITPEATLGVIERLTPGLAEAMRAASLKITPHAMLSRAVAGIRGRTLIINFPGSPKAAVENLQVISPIIPHAVELLQEKSEAEKGHSFLG